jgi:hypothetical protein
MGDSITIHQVCDFVEERSGILLTEFYTSAKTKLHIRCLIDGFEWRPSWDSISHGHWCPMCAEQAKPLIKDIADFASKKNGVLLTNEYSNSTTKLLVRCELDGFEWGITWSNLRRGHWCPKCAGQTLANLSDIRDFVAGRGGTLMSESFTSSDDKLTMRCEKDGHIWTARWGHVRSGSWCPKCAGQLRPTISEVRGLVESRNGALLSDSYVNAHDALRVKCNIDGHEWGPCWWNLVNGQWCPKCSIGKSQKLLQLILERLLAAKSISNYRGFTWLDTENGRQEIDIYFHSIKLAVEYDGEQHFKAVAFFGGDDGLKEVMRLDREKNKKISQHPEDVAFFVRFRFDEPITEEYVLRKIRNVGVII